MIGAPGSGASFSYANGYSTLILKFSPRALVARLSTLLGTPMDRPLKLTGAADPAMIARQRRLVMFLANEMEHSRGNIPELFLHEIEEAITINFLLGVEHNFSRLVHGTPRAAAPWQVKRAIDYMEQHWDQPITIDKLTEVTETSARSLFLLFKKTHDVSPMVYLSKIRLQRAREMLSRPDPGTSVTKVGFMCGFSNLGNFAMKYYAAFGERPSETLKNHLE